MSNTLHIYTRVSDPRQVKGFSLEAQKQEGIRRAGQLKMDHVIHTEPGESASNENLSNRPVLSSLIKQCQAGQVKHIFVTEQDRLARNIISQQVLNQVFIDNDVTLHTVSQTFNLKDTEHAFISDLFALLSKRENSVKTNRSRRGMLEAAKAGKWVTNILPYGYGKDENGLLVINEEEKEVYLTVVDMCLDDYGINAIARRLNAEGVPTRGQKVYGRGMNRKNVYSGEYEFTKREDLTWQGCTIRTMLNNTIYYGDRRYKGHVIPAPAIIEKDKWSQAQEHLKKRGKEKKNSYMFMLKGMMQCVGCGHTIGGVRYGDRYVCKAAKCMKSIACEKMENAIWLTIMQNSGSYISMAEDNFKSEKRNISPTYLKRRLSELRIKKSNLVTLFENSRINMTVFDERTDILEKEITEMTNLLDKHKDGGKSFNTWMEDFGKNIENLNLFSEPLEKREFLKKVIKFIHVSYDRPKNIYTVKITMHNIPEIIIFIDGNRNK